MSIATQFADSNSKPRALLLTPEAPYPVIGGGALRTGSLLEYLATKYTVDVVVFREPGRLDPVSAFPPGVAARIDVIDLPFHADDTIARVLRNARRVAQGAPPLVDRYSGF